MIGEQALVSTAHAGAHLLFGVAAGPLGLVTGAYHVAVTRVPNAEVPEPGSLALAAAGVAAAGARRRRPARGQKQPG